jgi:4-hydroxy-tetrahydrodipicolinate reductase
MITIAIAGAEGRMGRALLAELATADDVKVIAGTRASEPEWFAPADVIIDFTAPVYSLELMATGKPIVCGTTGFDDVQYETWARHGANVPLFWASNFSVGVHVLNRLAAQAAAMLPGYDAEIVEMHHNQKEDAPSGTALTLGRMVAQARNQNFDDVAMLSREGAKAKRVPGEIGFATLRGGGVIGEHQLVLAGAHDRITLGHFSQSRQIYAAGAIQAARWLVQQAPGVYGMDDLVGGE